MILHFTDPHFEKTAFAFISSRARELTADVCISGDLIDLRKPDLDAQIEWVSGWVKAQPFQIFLCSGNHDPVELATDPFYAGWLDRLHDGDRVVSMGCGKSRTTGRTIGCLPYGYIFPATRSPFAGADILLHHEPPSGTATAVGEGNDWGSSDLAEYLAFGRHTAGLVLSGHVHQSAEQLARCGRSMICNPGACDTPHRIPYAVIDFPAAGGPARVHLFDGAIAHSPRRPRKGRSLAPEHGLKAPKSSARSARGSAKAPRREP